MLKIFFLTFLVSLGFATAYIFTAGLREGRVHLEAIITKPFVYTE